jgi:hypothetical protein
MEIPDGGFAEIQRGYEMMVIEETRKIIVRRRGVSSRRGQRAAAALVGGLIALGLGASIYLGGIDIAAKFLPEISLLQQSIVDGFVSIASGVISGLALERVLKRP